MEKYEQCLGQFTKQREARQIGGILDHRHICPVFVKNNVTVTIDGSAQVFCTFSF